MPDETPLTISEQAKVTAPPVGSRVRKAFMMRQFIPDDTWITRNVVLQGKGASVLVGRVFGHARKAEERTNMTKEGKVLQSTVLTGIFKFESYITGELGDATTVYLPDAYAMKVGEAFKSDPEIKIVEIDCDIGLEATGKTIPYEWVVIAFREGEEMAVLKRLQNSRPRPLKAFAPAPGLTGPETGQGVLPAS